MRRTSEVIRSGESSTATLALRRAFVVGAIFALSVLHVPARAANEAIHFAVTDVAGLEKLQREWTQFKNEIARLTGLSLRFFPVKPLRLRR